MPRPSVFKRVQESVEETRKDLQSRGADLRERRRSARVAKLDYKKRKKEEEAKQKEKNGKNGQNGNNGVVREIKAVRITDDVDFARDDYDGRIKRCKERIRDGFHEKTYRDKIKRLEAAKKARAEIEAQFAGKSFESIKRIGALEIIEHHLARNGDPCGELENIRSILAAYNGDELKWDGNTTFWCQGKKIAGPMPFTWEDFRKYNTKENRGSGGFWVEGGDDPNEPTGTRNVHNYVGPVTKDKLMIRYTMAIRLDVLSGGTDVNGDPFPELDIEVIHDTGCTDMMIWDEDMKTMMGANAADDVPKDHMMGYTVAYLADGSHMLSRSIAVEVNLVGINVKTKEEGMMVDPWTTIRCDINEPGQGNDQGIPRLDGNWCRSILYTACIPETPTNRLFVSTHKSGFMGAKGLPNIPESERPGPRFRQPNQGVIFTYDDQTKKWTATANRKVKGNVPLHAYC